MHFYLEREKLDIFVSYISLNVLLIFFHTIHLGHIFSLSQLLPYCPPTIHYPNNFNFFLKTKQNTKTRKPYNKNNKTKTETKKK